MHQREPDHFYSEGQPRELETFVKQASFRSEKQEGRYRHLDVVGEAGRWRYCSRNDILQIDRRRAIEVVVGLPGRAIRTSRWTIEM